MTTSPTPMNMRRKAVAKTEEAATAAPRGDKLTRIAEIINSPQSTFLPTLACVQIKQILEEE